MIPTAEGVGAIPHKFEESGEIVRLDSGPHFKSLDDALLYINEVLKAEGEGHQLAETPEGWTYGPHKLARIPFLAAIQ